MTLREVWQYPIPLDAFAPFRLTIPEDSKFLTLHQNGKGEWALYFEVDPAKHTSLEIRFFMIVGTGQKLPSSVRYLGTFSFGIGLLILHAYEIVPPPAIPA